MTPYLRCLAIESFIYFIVPKILLTFQLLNREIIIIRQFHMKKKQKNIGFVGRKSVKKDVKVVEHALDIDEESSVYLS